MKKTILTLLSIGYISICMAQNDNWNVIYPTDSIRNFGLVYQNDLKHIITAYKYAEFPNKPEFVKNVEGFKYQLDSLGYSYVQKNMLNLNNFMKTNLPGSVVKYSFSNAESKLILVNTMRKKNEVFYINLTKEVLEYTSYNLVRHKRYDAVTVEKVISDIHGLAYQKIPKTLKIKGYGDNKQPPAVILNGKKYGDIYELGITQDDIKSIKVVKGSFGMGDSIYITTNDGKTHQLDVDK